MGGQQLIRTESFRRVLYASNLVKIENSFVSPADCLPQGSENYHQLVLPYHGLFKYCVGSRDWLIDSARALCISPGWDFRDEHPVPDLGHGAVLITARSDFFDEVSRGGRASADCRFNEVAIPQTPFLRLLAHRLVRGEDGSDPLAYEELAAGALNHVSGVSLSSSQSSKVVRRAKELLHSIGSERFTLQKIAHLVGTSPGYLTQEFKRSEGVPLYKYHLQLRLNRALFELPHSSDITTLALGLGFASHSHFSSAFRREFGVTPSQFREGVSL